MRSQILSRLAPPVPTGVANPANEADLIKLDGFRRILTMTEQLANELRRSKIQNASAQTNPYTLKFQAY